VFKAGEHVYTANRCIFCNINNLDDSIYGPFECEEDREALTYTTDSGVYGPTDKRFDQPYFEALDL